MTEKTPNVTDRNCNKCGICLSVCPVYRELAEEHASPRARVQLIRFFKEGRLSSSMDLKTIMDKCLMCGSCAANCPSGVDHYRQFMEMRADMARDHGQSPVIRSLVYLLAREYRLKLAAGLAKAGRRILPRALAQKYRLGPIPIQRFPGFNARPFRQDLPEKIAPEGPARGRVLYFTGCATHYLFDDTGRATIDLLSRLGYEVFVPRSQTCCSIPMLFHGERDRATANIRTNLKCLDQPGLTAIVVDCPTCGAALKETWPELAGSLGLDADAAGRVSNQVMDMVSFVDQYSDKNNDRDADKSSLKPHTAPLLRVTYHLPCHLKNSLAALNQTRQVLEKLPGIVFVPAPDADSCCGGGGTFFYEFPEVSGKMVERKIKNAAGTGADVWVTDCPVCRINLSGNLDENAGLEVMHPAVLMERYLR